jgi:hypothetical protein
VDLDELEKDEKEQKKRRLVVAIGGKSGDLEG